MIQVLFFGPVADRIGSCTLQVEHRRNMSLQSLRDELSELYPQAFAIVSFAAVYGEHVRDMSQSLADTSEVAFMSKFSGG